MGPDFDEGSFKKARSFLLVFSTMLLILWYFKAEMNTLSVLGNSIKFTANAEDLWLVLSLANGYFFCRFIQHLPEDWDKPGRDLENIFDSTLCRTTEILYKRKLRASAWAAFKEDNDVARVTKFKVKPSGSRYRAREESSGFFMLLRPEMKVEFSLPYTWTEGNRECASTGIGTTVTPHKAVVIYSRGSSFIKGVFLAPWFTEHLFPMIYAICAISVGLWSWYNVHNSAPMPLNAVHSDQSLRISWVGSPDVIACISERLQAKQSILSVACVPTPLVMGRLAEAKNSVR